MVLFCGMLFWKWLLYSWLQLQIVLMQDYQLHLQQHRCLLSARHMVLFLYLIHDKPYDGVLEVQLELEPSSVLFLPLGNRQRLFYVHHLFWPILMYYCGQYIETVCFVCWTIQHKCWKSCVSVVNELTLVKRLIFWRVQHVGPTLNWTRVANCSHHSQTIGEISNEVLCWVLDWASISAHLPQKQWCSWHFSCCHCCQKLVPSYECSDNSDDVSASRRFRFWFLQN